MADEKLAGEKLKQFNEVSGQAYAEQAQFFLNAFWNEIGESHPENVWNWHQEFVKLDQQQHNALPPEKRKGGPDGEWKEGDSLDEFWSHKFLENIGKTLTAIAFRNEFRAIDINFDKRMAMLEFLLWNFKEHKWCNVPEMMKRPQGTNEELKKAQAALKAVQEEIAKIEKEKASLEKKSEQGGVKGNAAKNALAQLLAADPTELNRATVTAEAAVRKAQKSKNVAAQGAVWWVARSLTEAKKYKPSRGKGSK